MLYSGAANLIIRDKRSDGYIEKDAWGLDFPMSNLDRTRSLARVYQNAARQAPEWALDHVQPIPELSAAILMPHLSIYAMSLTPGAANDWQAEDAYWKIVQPPGAAQTWLKWYDGRADQLGSILGLTRISKNPSWGLRFLRARPPVGQTDPIGIAVTLNCIGTHQYQLYLPGDEGFFPQIYRSDDSGATAYLADELARDDAARWCAGAFERQEQLAVIHIPDHLIIYLGDLGDPWIYYEEGLDISEGHVRLEVTGGQAAFHFGEIVYSSQGTIERNFWITPPDRLNDEEADSVDYLGDVPDGTGIGVSMITDAETPPNVYPKAVLSSTGARTPVLYEIQATRPAIRSEPVTDLLFDNEVTPGDKGKLEIVEFTVAQGWRGSSIQAQLRTAGEYTLRGNEKVQLKVALQSGGALSWYTQVTGYLETPHPQKSGREPGVIRPDWSARDRFCRLQNKGAKMLPSFDGWSFENAFYWVMCEVAGFPDADILLDDGAAEFYFPIGAGGMDLKFDATLDLATIADQLCAAAGRRWGVATDGSIFTEALGTDAYSGTPDWVLDDDTVTAEDVCYFIEVDRDVFVLRNHVIVIGQDSSGNDVLASWMHENSMSDPTADPFIGDEWCTVLIGPQGADPWLHAQFTGQELMQYRGLIVWETNGKPTLFPDHYVEVNTTGLDVELGTIFKIIEKWGRLDSSSGEFICKFVGAVI